MMKNIINKKPLLCTLNKNIIINSKRSISFIPAACSSLKFNNTTDNNNINYNTIRKFNSSFLSNLDDDLDIWPKRQTNSILNICPQGEKMIVERLGKLHSIHEGGWFFSIPFIDNICYVVDMREKAFAIPAQSCITKDNVHVKVSGNLYMQFNDAEKAAYGSSNPIYAVKQHAQSSMRAAIGELELDQILHARAQVNTMIKSTVQEAAGAWGIDIKRYEITEVLPDKFISEAMDKQAAAERERRKKVLEAEGDKRSAELQSEGSKIRMINESEGNLIKVKNEAEARKIQLVLEAEGEAIKTFNLAEANAKAIHIISKALEQEGSAAAARLNIAKDYIAMYGSIGSKSNTMIFSDRPADINSLFAQAQTVMKNTPDSNNNIIIESVTNNSNNNNNKTKILPTNTFDNNFEKNK